MANPALSNNTPSAGQISWDDFVIRYDGVSYSVDAGSTASRWVWWKYNGGAPIIEAGAALPDTLTDDDLVLFSNRDGLGVRIQSTNLIDGELLVDGTILADALAANIINSQHIVTAGLDAGVIKFGAMSGDRIAVNTLSGDRIVANTIGVSKLIVSDFTNYIADGDVVDPTLANWQGVTRGTVVGDIDYIEWTAGDQVDAHVYNLNMFELKPGDQFIFVGEASTPAQTGDVSLTPAIETVDGDGGVVTWVQDGPIVLPGDTGWTPIKQTITIPAGLSRRGRFGPFANGSADGLKVRLRGMFLQKKNDGELIVDGTILGKHVKADEILGTHLKGETITGREIAAESITTSKLIISDLTNLAVDGELLDPTLANWHEVGLDNIVRVSPTNEPAYLSNKNQTITANIFFRNENMFAISEGDEFYISAEVSTPATNDQDLKFNLTAAVYDQNGASQLWRAVEEGQFLVSPGTDWTKLNGTLKITEPSLAKAQFNPFVSDIAGAAGLQEIRLRNMVVRRKNAGTLIIDGTLEGKALKANTITSEEINAGTITGDLFAAEVVHSGVVRAGDLDDNGEIESGYSEMGSRGIYTVNSSGEVIASLPTDSDNAAFVKAHMELLSADVRDNFTMHGTNNQIATEGELTLSNGIEAPTVPPTLKQVWDQVQLNKTTAVPPHAPRAGYNLGTFAFSPSQATSMAWNSEWGCWVVIQQKSNGFRVWRFTASGDIYNNFGSGRPWVDDYNDRSRASVCFNSEEPDEAYLFQTNGTWVVWAPENINRIPASWILDESDRPPALSYDAVNNQYMLVQNIGGGAGTIHIRRFKVTAGANYPNATSMSTMNLEAGSGTDRRINGVVFGTQLGVSGYAINADDYQTVFAYNTSGTALDGEGTNRTWLKPGGALGLAHNGTQFASIDAGGVVTYYENWTWLGLDRIVWIGASAYDSDTAGHQANPHVGQLAGQHETPVGTMRAFSLYRRSKLRITMPETNDSGGVDDADKWRLYFKRGGSAAPTDKNLLKLIGEVGSPTAASSITIGSDPTGAAPPGGIKGQPSALNNFPGADPARIESAQLDTAGNPIIALRGDGAGRLGPFAWNSLGKDANDTGWIAAVFQNGWQNYGGSYTPASYRKVGNRVYLRGLVRLGDINVPIFTLPAGFLPPYRMMLSGIANTSGLSISGDGQKSTGPPSDNTTGSTSSHTHTMKMHSHNVTYAITGVATAVAVRVDVNIDGSVVLSDTTAGTGYLSLDGISFFID